MEALYTPNGLTVRQLKELVKDLPEENAYGQEFEVWVETSTGLSTVVKQVTPLNARPEGCDLIFEVTSSPISSYGLTSKR